MLDWQAVHADEAVTFAIETHTVLRATIHGLHLERVGMETDVGSHLQRSPFGMLGTSDGAAAQAGGQIDPAIGPNRRGIDAQLRTARGCETGEQHATFVGHTIAVVVL